MLFIEQISLLVESFLFLLKISSLSKAIFGFPASEKAFFFTTSLLA